MRIKPILFNTEMVRAILEGRKTMTRRVVKFNKGQNPAWTGYVPDGSVLYGSNNIPAAKAPFRKDDVLWVRETWRIQSAHRFECDAKITYKAGGDLQKVQFSNWDDYDRFIWNKHVGDGKWYPSIHMPREAARIFLRVTNVRAERLKDITATQAMDEGFTDWNDFVRLWNKTIKPSDIDHYGWNANPWVWVIEFERCEKPKEW